MRRNLSRTGLVRKKRELRYAIKNWVGKLYNIPCFIIGNGPSLNDELSKNVISKLEQFFTIGINRSFYLFDPTILFWQDISLWKDEATKIHKLQALKVVRDIADPHRIFYNFHVKNGPYQFDTTKTHVLYGAGNSAAICTQLAVSLGCNPIILLGCDCQLDQKGNTDFYGANKHWTSQTLQNCYKGLLFIKNQCPVSIINCSNNNLWERQSITKVMEELTPVYNKGRIYHVEKLIH